MGRRSDTYTAHTHRFMIRLAALVCAYNAKVKKYCRRCIVSANTTGGRISFWRVISQIVILETIKNASKEKICEAIQYF